MTNARRDPYGPRKRWLMYLSSLCVVFACSMLAFEVEHHWSWPLFVCGLAIGFAAILGYEVLVKVMMAAHLTDAEIAGRGTFLSRAS